MKLSHSKINTFSDCPRKYKLKYIDGYKKISDSAALSIGAAFHKGIECKSLKEAQKYMDKDQFFTEKEEVNRIIVEEMVIGYLEKYKDEKVIDTEMKLTCKLNSNEFTGIIDEIVCRDDKFYLSDLKTASQIPKDPDKYKSQLFKYIHLVNKQNKYGLDGIIIKIIKKPSIKQKKTETIEEYKLRLHEEYKDKDKYFKEFVIPMKTGFSPVDEMLNVDNWATQIHNAVSSNNFPQSKNRCYDFGGCEYLPICNHYINHEVLYTKKESDIEYLLNEVDGIKEDLEKLESAVDDLEEDLEKYSEENSENNLTI